ncbi:MAG: aldehyde dehydrogenase family protein [Candidatus Marinimicrobia bacterium]|nr:aldehyde dehydrogenase family protein [Candidatus Neomarinimicrobiota bacterium]MCF7850319.1 aldehyde dehydrogenase family protein [Candidatus Neomarinimicrobiota bacterium]MCF7903911.1 aldehyde dehydrogenase family protein [Candidatus Neomarinimicrobiota bacterium]
MSEQSHSESISPATGKVIGETPLHTSKDIKSAVQRIRQVQRSWAELSFRERGDYLRKMQRHLTEHGEEYARVIAQDNGKSLADAYMTEITPAIMAFDYYIKHTARVLRQRKVKGSHIFGLYTRNKLQFVPRGVIGVISPWNYPLTIPIHEILMALMAGNGAIYKAASETQMVGQVIQKIIASGGLPEDLFVQVNIAGRLAGDAFLNAGIDKLFFTGSVPVGKILMKKASETLTPVSLELGGNDPMIVCAEANLKKAANGAIWAGMSNSGQSCAGIERVYVHEAVYDEFIAILRERLLRIKVGDPESDGIHIGTMTTARQQESVQRMLDDAIKAGARIAGQSQVDKKVKQAMPATILTDVTHDMEIMQEETFGPVVGIMKFSSIDEAIDLANDSSVGLTASVWTTNHRLGRQIANQLEAGVVTINGHLFTHGMANLPWGGFKDSSLGRTHGEFGLQAMTETRVIVTDYLPNGLQFFWTPVSGFVYRRWVGFTMLLGGPWQVKLRGLVKLIFGLRKI